jgi:hypothetical protein
MAAGALANLAAKPCHHTRQLVAGAWVEATAHQRLLRIVELEA